MTQYALETKRTYCKVCMVHCGLVAEVAGETVLKVRGDREHPLTRGYSCPKGRAIGQIHHLPDAFTHPMMKKGGALVPVSWDEALDDIATTLRRIVDAQHAVDDGKFAVGAQVNEGHAAL